MSRRSAWSYTRLAGDDAAPDDPSTRPSDAMSRLGTWRAYWLGAVVCIGGFLFGYDSGIAGGVLTLKAFARDFGYPASEKTRVSSLVVGLQQLGAFVACFAIWPITHRYGRKWALVLCSIIFCIGAVLETINTHSLPAFYVGRVIAGVGLGGSSVVIPMIVAEMAPPSIRGRIGSFYQLMYTIGIFTSYWVDYGVALHVSDRLSREWQIPVGLQLIPAALLGLGMLTLKESTRWLTQNGRHEEAWESLKWIRGGDSEATQQEMNEIRRGVEAEIHAREGFRLTGVSRQHRILAALTDEVAELLDEHSLKPTIIAAAVFTAQQATGATAFAYYGPQYFGLLVGDEGNTDLLLTAIFGAIKVAACLTFVIFVVESVDRRHILTGGALIMAACQTSCAAVLATHPAPASAHVTSSGIATIALIYLFVIAYNLSWGPLPWPYVGEIFPTRTREAGIGVGVAFQWLFNFVFSLTTPYMIDNLGWGTFLLWGVFDLCIAAFSWFCLKETRGKTLEEINRSDVRRNSIDSAKDSVE